MHHKNRRKCHKSKKRFYEKDRKKHSKRLEEKAKKEPINESDKENEMGKLHQYNHRQMEERRIEEANRLKQCKRKSNYELQLSKSHYRRKAARDYAVSPDNTLREITGAMPNMELKHASSKEAIYTDDQLM